MITWSNQKWAKIENKNMKVIPRIYIVFKCGGKCIDIETNFGDSGIKINLMETTDRHRDRDLIIQSISETLFRN
ncbi:MAG: hypothetical protein A2381_10120 [Bdellovibrionales bacterium RIFOXYB1_FULL_37_110]|nr:MAG: hypothetical protein A2417_02635 [Bdellovibrionales bacterium RIFOXYC1_FULL_37_79]OFZ61120.1 MAG: hypothetical protein A2381_10120 [Bdellovibrionales bacterium RIFOXYB1_FULL_37_110]OFZ61601.1 MAG: hypothetical protein A2577_10460 [Bdellovibrionales bacterium RIFOXYD1_FULL_36_51]